MGANPGLDPWIPEVGRELVLPTRHIVPAGERRGLLINLAELRLYHFPGEDAPVESFPIGVGRYAWSTPLGATEVVGKRKDPVWTVPESIREEDPTLPERVPPGPNNPLGRHAIYLGMTGYLLHGTNKPWGIGMRVTHGCIRLYPEHIARLFAGVEAGTPVRIVDQPIKAGWDGDDLYVEVHVEPTYARERGAPEPLPPERLFPLAAKVVQEAAGLEVGRIDWAAVRQAVEEASGIPVKASLPLPPQGES